MFLTLWNFLRGYVTIEVTGFSVERFINLAAHRNIYIWDVMPSGSKISMKMSAGAFKRLKGVTRKTRCKMRIVEKSGMPFLFFKYKDRKIFVFGILFFICALYVLSSFVWIVEINGNERIKTNAIISYCDEIGLKPGAFKPGLNTADITAGFMTEFKDLAWFSLEIKGTRASINMVETIESPKIIDKTTPCDVIAADDGLITDITVISGTQQAKVNDVVKKGDVLVSGMLVIKDGEEIKGYRYTHADAVVNAKVVYEVSLSEPLMYTVKNYTGNTKKTYAIDILKKKFNIINTGITYKNYDRIVTEKPIALGGDFALPLSFRVTEYKEYTPVLKKRTTEEVLSILDNKLKTLIDAKIGNEDATIIDSDVVHEIKNELAYMTAKITLEKRIDEQKNVEEP